MITLKDGDNILSKIIFTELASENANDLIRAGFPFGDRELCPPLSQRLLQSTGSVSPSTKLVAYHNEEKRAIGFLCLNEDNALINSIKFVFVDPRFRRMGLASRMVTYGLRLAKEKGAKKVFLDVEGMNSNVINMYADLGFQKVGTKLVGQGFITELSRLKVITSTLKGQGYIAKFTSKESGQLIALPLNSKRNRKLLFNIYQSCMGQRLTDFFKLNVDNIINGYSQIWSHFCLRDAFTNKETNSYVLIFNHPFFSNASIELNSLSPTNIPLILNDLVKLLDKRGIAYAHITMFNITDDKCLQWFKEKGFRLSHFTTMGISL